MVSWQEHIQNCKKEPGNENLSFKELLSKASKTWKGNKNKVSNKVSNKKTKKRDKPVKTQKIKKKRKFVHSQKKHKKHKSQTYKVKPNKNSKGGAGFFNQITSAVTGVFKAPDESIASKELRDEIINQLKNDDCNKIMQIKETISFANDNSKLYNSIVNVIKLNEHQTLLDNIGIISKKSKFELTKLLDKLKNLKPNKTLNNKGECVGGNFANDEEKNALIALLENTNSNNETTLNESQSNEDSNDNDNEDDNDIEDSKENEDNNELDKPTKSLTETDSSQENDIEENSQEKVSELNDTEDDVENDTENNVDISEKVNDSNEILDQISQDTNKSTV